ncbi:MAG TPA: OmpA family protein [Acetobacteraceae bacterium]|nr:OmpA family protein [Acetobacteraceae bacterium]
MRASLTFTALVVAGLVQVPWSNGWAADPPSASSLIQSLTPGSAGTTRGIRLGQPPAPAPSGTPASTGAAARPASTRAAANQGEARLSVPFASGSAEISPVAARVLDELGKALTSPNLAAYKFRVEGHTDTVGAPDMNKALSEQRANSVTEYLVTKFGIDRSRLTPVGMGEDGLLVATGPGVPNAANRQVRVVTLTQ